jgi:plastocyanin
VAGVPTKDRFAMRAGRLACALAIALGALAMASAPALAGGGAWSNEKDIKRQHFEFGPIDVKPGQNAAVNVTVPKSAMPKINGYIVRMKPNLQYMDGSVPRVDVLHLHHGVWLNLSRQSDTSPFQPLEPIFFAGEEKTTFNIPKGYGYEYLAGSTWILNHMIHNNTPNATKVKLVWDLDIIPATSKLAKKVRPVEPLWMDVRRGWGYPVFDVLRDTGANGTYTFPDQAASDPYAGRTIQNEFKMPWSGTLVSAIGHLHPGGLYDDIDVIRPGATLPAGSKCRSVAANIRGTKMRRSCVKATAGSKPNSVRIFRSLAKYYDRAGPVSWDVSLTASRPDWRVNVNAGDTLRVTTTYDSTRGAWYEAMGIVMLYVARGERKGIDPFKRPVDPNGVLTHGHLPENDNHGGGAGVLADPRSVPDGPAPAKIEIKNFQFSPGDLGLLGSGGLVPTVGQGQSIQFVNQDPATYVWHSITACAAPCNAATGISYPLADGPAATQFDSGQLGYGSKVLTPATNKLTYDTPANLSPGTYTYFCRVHSFMRGAFRVK